MKTLLKNKYFIAMVLVFVLIYNGVLFLVIDKELLKLGAFWLNYSLGLAGIIFACASCLVLSMSDKRSLNLSLPFIAPFFFFGFIVSVILTFFISKISFTVIGVVFIIIYGLGLMACILGAFYKNSLKNIEEKEITVMDKESLVAFLNDLKHQCSDANTVKVLSELEMLAKLIEGEDKESDAKIYEMTYFLKKDLKARTKTNFFYNAKRMEEMLERRINK